MTTSRHHVRTRAQKPCIIPQHTEAKVLTRQFCYVVLYLGGCNEDLSILWSSQVVHDAHQLTGLSFGLLSLRHMQVHLIAIKVSVIGAADALIEAKGPAATANTSQSLCCREITPAGEICI